MFDLIGIIKQYGIFWGVCIAAILILFYGIGRSDLFADFFSKIRHKFGHFISHIFHKKENKKIKNIISDKVISDSDIINHDIFNYIDFYIYFTQIDELIIEEDVRIQPFCSLFVLC